MAARETQARKIKVGRKTFACQKYLYRLNGSGLNGWQIRPPGYARYFADGTYGGAAASYAVAVEDLERFLRELVRQRISSILTSGR